ncbi:MAG TPA: hypothetical protein VN769_12860 [Xanthobacteraceae bacterium]|jgi:hypothetical protein|nr:hypothetical protein [Xanthobacteraceae bacterium]
MAVGPRKLAWQPLYLPHQYRLGYKLGGGVTVTPSARRAESAPTAGARKAERSTGQCPGEFRSERA